MFELPAILILLAIGLAFGIPIGRGSQRADDRVQDQREMQLRRFSSDLQAARILATFVRADADYTLADVVSDDGEHRYQSPQVGTAIVDAKNWLSVNAASF